MRLSAGAIWAVCPIIDTPTFRMVSTNCAVVKSTRNPGIASSLSSVPPVCPSPRPDTIGTGTPQAATIGARQIDTLSPTPPVECLSTLIPGTDDRSSTSPLRSIASVNSLVSESLSPRRNAAINQALIW